MNPATPALSLSAQTDMMVQAHRPYPTLWQQYARTD
jgi:hypothetical protein